MNFPALFKPSELFDSVIFILITSGFKSSLMNVKIEDSWKEILEDEFKKPYFKQIVDHLKNGKGTGENDIPARHPDF